MDIQYNISIHVQSISIIHVYIFLKWLQILVTMTHQAIAKRLSRTLLIIILCRSAQIQDAILTTRVVFHQFGVVCLIIHCLVQVAYSNRIFVITVSNSYFALYCRKSPKIWRKTYSFDTYHFPLR